MDTALLVLLILAILYVPLWLYVKFGEKPKEKGFVPYGPCIMIKTHAGMKLIDRLGKYTRFWKVCGIFSRIVTLLLMIIMVGIIILDLSLLPQAFGQKGMGIQYALAIPGLNPMLPIVYGWIALIVAMVVHELAHGFQSRANNIDVKSTGILWCVVPVGAFVEPDDEQVEKTSRRARVDLYAAGITTNTIVAAIMFIIMMFSMTGGIACEYGMSSPAVYSITSDSPAYNTIPTTSIVVDVYDCSTSTSYTVTDIDSFNGAITHYGDYRISYIYKGDLITTSPMKLGTQVNGVISNSAAERVGLKAGYFLVSIEDTATHTVKNIGSVTSFTDYMNGTTPGQEVKVTYVDREGVEWSNTVALGSKGSIGYMGMTSTTAGMAFTTPEIILNTGINPYYGASTIGDYAKKTLTYLSLPFNGFSPIPESTHWWFHSTAMSDDAFWIAMSTVYWIFWLNLLLGITNALPAIPFDGGFLFVGGVDFILERFIKDEEARKKHVDRICSFVTYFMIIALVLVLMVIIF